LRSSDWVSAATRGKNTGTVAAATKQVQFVFQALRDRHVRALHPRAHPQARRRARLGVVDEF
jgi:hypothetical protein